MNSTYRLSDLTISGAGQVYDPPPKETRAKVDTRRKSRSKPHSKKQLAQLAALEQTDQAAWATAVLLSACNVAYEMLLAEGWEEQRAKGFARALAEKSGEKLGETLAGTAA